LSLQGFLKIDCHFDRREKSSATCLSVMLVKKISPSGRNDKSCKRSTAAYRWYYSNFIAFVYGITQKGVLIINRYHV
jgi:hypothetical protein